MGWFSHKPTQQKEVEAAIRVASNLYENTKPGAVSAPAPLHFRLPDSPYRYLMFCLSAMEVACASKMTDATTVVNECLHFLVRYASTECSQEFFGGSTDLQVAATNGAAYLQDFLNRWSIYVALEKAGGKNAEIIDLICSMIHRAESSEPITKSDAERLASLALQICCWLPTMNGAFAELVNG